MIDATHHIATVRRTVGRRTLEAGEARVLTVSQVYPTDIEDLWEVVTTAERIGRWFLPVSGELKEGGHFQLEGNASGTVTACDRPRGYAATWEFGGQVSWIEVRLTPEGDGTRFLLEHVAHVDDALWDEYGPGAVGVGWDGGFYGLANHLTDRQAVLGTDEVAAWMASGEGKAFNRMASEAWAEASIADGADPAQAREQAARVLAFYTGG